MAGSGDEVCSRHRFSLITHLETLSKAFSIYSITPFGLTWVFSLLPSFDCCFWGTFVWKCACEIERRFRAFFRNEQVERGAALDISSG